MTTWGHPTTCSRRQGQTATCIRLTPLGAIWLVKHISHLRYVGDKKATHPPTNRLTCQRLDHWPLTRSQRRDRNRFGSILYTRNRPGSAVTSLVPQLFPVTSLVHCFKRDNEDRKSSVRWINAKTVSHWYCRLSGYWWFWYIWWPVPE